MKSFWNKTWSHTLLTVCLMPSQALKFQGFATWTSQWMIQWTKTWEDQLLKLLTLSYRLYKINQAIECSFIATRAFPDLSHWQLFTSCTVETGLEMKLWPSSLKSRTISALISISAISFFCYKKRFVALERSISQIIIWLLIMTPKLVRVNQRLLKWWLKRLVPTWMCPCSTESFSHKVLSDSC